ncbi:MAG: acetylglutamate kinase [Candidatus Dadabacteria bacterium]
MCAIKNNNPANNSTKPLLFVIKIGGNIIDNPQKLEIFLKQYAAFNSNTKEIFSILVHGGGKLATSLAGQLNIQQKIIEGRRVTDSETLKVVTMVYAGYINKTIISQLQGYGLNALGLTGTDGNLLLAHKRGNDSAHGTKGVDYGYVGDLDEVNTSFLTTLMKNNFTPVIAPITHDGKGQLLNTNADTIAQEIATAMSKDYNVTLVYSFEKKGVLKDAEDDSTLIQEITPSSYNNLKEKQLVFAGMVPKLDNAFSALSSGVSKVIIGKAEDLDKLLNGETGTSIVAE